MVVVMKDMYVVRCNVYFFQAEDGIRDLVRSRGLGDVYKRQVEHPEPHGLSCEHRMRCFLIVFLFACINMVNAQVNWSWQPLAPLPMPTANNAVCAAMVNGDHRVYSFGGITTGLELENIHREAYMYSNASVSYTHLTLPTSDLV